MRHVILVHPDFDACWPFAADHFHTLWRDQGDVEFLRLDVAERRPVAHILANPETITRLVALSVPVTASCLEAMYELRELATDTPCLADLPATLKSRNIRWYTATSEGFWGQSVSEFALALTLCGLRRIPQLHHAMLSDLTIWEYQPPDGIGQPGTRGVQFGDDLRFSNGTVAGKRVRIVGAGNVASRYARFMQMLGADVAAWDPYASEPCFHLAGTRREHHLARLMRDAEIFAPMLPLTSATEGIVKREHLLALPKGCLVVLVTRAQICDMPTLRERVLADELSLAADVWDVEPLPLNDPLLGRSNVVHTPHNAGRTISANQQFAEHLAAQFDPFEME